MAPYQIPGNALADQAIGSDKLSLTISGALVPIGGIIMWSGTADQIAGFPNWQLCDGSAISSGSLSGTNTPNLVGRFILGTDTYDTGEGRWEETITGDNTPTGGSKNAVLITHKHTVNNQTSNLDQWIAFSRTDINPSDPSAASDDTGYLSGSGSQGNDRIYSINTTGKDNTGSDSTTQTGTNANLPPYYSLAYIMRVA